MTKTIPVIATIAIAAILMGSVFGTTQTFNTANADTIKDKKIDKSFILCAIETDGQNIYPDNDIDALVGGTAGVFYPESWTFVLIEESDLVEVAKTGAFSSHATVNGQDHDDDQHYNCTGAAIDDASAPGPSISVNRNDVVQIRLVSDIDRFCCFVIFADSITDHDSMKIKSSPF